METMRLIRYETGNFMDWRNSWGVATLRARREGLVPDTLWVVRATGPSVTAAFFNDIEKDIHLDYCRTHGIPVRRTIGGGGCAFFDEGSTYCMAFFSTREIPQKTHSEIFGLLHPSLARSLSERLGIEVCFRPLNDLQVGPRKFSMAGLVFDGEIAYLILILQVRKPSWDLSSILNVAPEKMEDKETKTLEGRTTWLEREAGRSIPLEEVEEACMEGIGRALGSRIVPGSLSEAERRYADEAFERLNAPEFQFGRTERQRFGTIPPFVKRGEFRMKVPNGPLVRAVVLVGEETLQDLLITGSLMATPLEPSSPIDEIEKALKGIRLDREEILGRIRSILERPGYMVAGADADTFCRALWGAVCMALKGPS